MTDSAAMTTESRPDVGDALRGQLERRARIKGVVVRTPSARKRTKRITRNDVIEAVNAALDAATRELREHQNDLPRWREAMAYATAIIQKHKVTP